MSAAALSTAFCLSADDTHADLEEEDLEISSHSMAIVQGHATLQELTAQAVWTSGKVCVSHSMPLYC